MSTRIRHILPADHLYAVYFLDKAPYATLLKCQHRALVSRPALDDDTEYVDEIIGYVLDGTIVPADEVSEDTQFMWYVDRSEFDDANWKTYVQSVMTWGTQAYQQRHPAPPPAVVNELTSNPPQRRKRRARGQSQRGTET